MLLLLQIVGMLVTWLRLVTLLRSTFTFELMPSQIRPRNLLCCRPYLPLTVDAPFQFSSDDMQ
jgi:hypothetical protein